MCRTYYLQILHENVVAGWSRVWSAPPTAGPCMEVFQIFWQRWKDITEAIKGKKDYIINCVHICFGNTTNM